MSLVQAKCTNCGSNLQVDASKEAAICPYCNSAYIVEKAITLFSGNNYGKIDAQVVNIYGCTAHYAEEQVQTKSIVASKQVIEKIHLSESFNDAIQFLFSSTLSTAFVYLKSDGSLGLYGSVDPNIDPNIFTWKNLKKILFLSSLSQCHYDARSLSSLPAVAVTFDGNCMVSECYSPKEFGKPCDIRYNISFPSANQYNAVKQWTDIADIYCYKTKSQYHVIGLKNNGTVVSFPEIPEISKWRGIKKIVPSNNALFAVTVSGKVECIGAIHSDIIEDIRSWSDIEQVFPRNDIIYGLQKHGCLVQAGFNQTKSLASYSSVATINNDVAILLDGSMEALPGSQAYRDIKKFGTGNCQWKDGYALTVDGRVSTKNEFDVSSGVISIIFASSFRANYYCFLMGNGRINDCGKILDIVLFSGNPSEYQKKVSQHIVDNSTRICLKGYYTDCLQYWNSILKSLKWKDRSLKNDVKIRIEEIYRRLQIINNL